MTLPEADSITKLEKLWASRWDEALKLWSSYVQLRSPVFCTTEKEEKEHGISGGIAHIRLSDHVVVISLTAVKRFGLADYPLEIMGHEIGHHVYCPGDLTDHGRVLARMAKHLREAPGNERMIANLYTDLMINHKLKRDHSLRMQEVYEKINEQQSTGLWNLYMRIYEILWLLKPETLCKDKITPVMEGDAVLGARLIKTYAKDWVGGAAGFALLCLPYLLESDANASKPHKKWLDVGQQSGDSIPGGLLYSDDDTEAVHPALDPKISGQSGEGEDSEQSDVLPDSSKDTQRAPGQARQPYELGEILKSIGYELNQENLAHEYYRKLALPHLIRFPVKEMPLSSEPVREGWEIWEPGEGIEKIDWMQTAMQSPVVIPGFTTMQAVYGYDAGQDIEKQPVDLDLYIDCSGSMPNPRRQFSAITLAGAIVVLSALRAGAGVQATLWSGKNQFTSTEGFIRDEKTIFSVMTGFFGGGTQFPIHKLRSTYLEDKSRDSALNKRPVHILVLSDDGVTTMFDKDEQGRSGSAIAKLALEKAQGGGTLALNLYSPEIVNTDDNYKLAKEIGFRIFVVNDWSGLIQFARKFSEETYS